MPIAHSKRYRSAVKVADLTKEYPLAEAVEVLSKFPKTKFDETVELSFRLGVDATAGEQMVRSSREDPILLKKACPALRCTNPIVPA